MDVETPCICQQCVAGNFSIRMCDKHLDEYIHYRQGVVAKHGWHTPLMLDCREWFKQQYMQDFSL